MILFSVGPRVPIDLTIRSFDFSEDLDSYLEASEARFSDILPDTEKTIIWAEPSKKHKTPISIIYLHGFSATRQETAPLCDMLAQKLGANLFYTRLTRHGRSGQAMAEATVNDWLNDAIEALEIGRRIGEKVLVVATSTGGTLATWLTAYERSDDILACILISPNFMPAESGVKFLTWPWAKVIIPLIFGKTYTWKPENELHERYWMTSYPTTAALPLMGLVQLVRKTDLSKIWCPTLVFLSSKDQIVKPEETEKLYVRFGSSIKKKVYIEDSQDPRHHVLAGDILSPNTTEDIARTIFDFVASLSEREKQL